MSNADTIDLIAGAEFGVLSPDEIRRMSVVPVTTSELYEGDVPKECGLFDTRMGVLDGRAVCPTDERGHIDCPGYFGHIELALPCLGYQYLKWITKILRCVCPMCAYPRFDASDPEVGRALRAAHGAARLKRAVDFSTKCRVCDRCGNRQPRIVKKDRTLLHCIQLVYRVPPPAGQRGPAIDHVVRFQPEMVMAVFQKITDADAENMGLNPRQTRPEWLITTVLPVPPPSMRPPARKSSQLPMHDDLTYKLCDIVKANRSLAKYMEKLQARIDAAASDEKAEIEKSSANALDCYRRILQYHVAVLVDNTIQGLPQAQQRSGRALRCIKSRLKGKEGRVRGNLNGKRVDFSARSVITPDPLLSIDQLGVPRVIAQKLTFPQKVTRFNLAHMRRLVQNGAYTYPGCNKIELRGRGRTRVYAMTISAADRPERRAQLAAELQVGDIVHRHLVDDDPVLFNRQPSLHKMSMMCHRVKVLPYMTFRLNVNVTGPYNADFDGDEMNMHVPQSVGSAVELREIASVTRQIVSPGTNRPVISLVQDSLLGLAMFTGEDVRVRRNQAMDLLMWCPEFKGFGGAGAPAPDREFPSLELLTRHMVPSLHARRRMAPYSSLGRRGDSDSRPPFKSVMKNIIHATYNDASNDPDGARETQALLDTTSHMAMRWLLAEGFSVGLRDLFVSKKVLGAMHTSRRGAKQRVLDIICKVHDGTFQNPTGRTNEEHFEQEVQRALSESFKKVGKHAEKVIDPTKNRLMRMIGAGSKGSKFNFSQMVAMVGQQAVAGKRVAYGFDGRTLPHFHKYDDGIRARGFVSSSYIDGLEPTEFFFHAQAGREGLIDTAVKTAETGYIQRRMVKAMEDLIVAEDGTVRNVAGRIVQLHYGGDGFDAAKLEPFKIPDWVFDKPDESLAWRAVRRADPAAAEPALRQVVRDLLGTIVSDDQSVYTPLALGRWLRAIVQEDEAARRRGEATGGDGDDEAASEPGDVVQAGLDLLKRIRDAGRTNLWMRDIHRNPALETVVRIFFTPPVVGSQLLRRLRPRHLRRVIDHTMRHLARARAMPGEPVGIIGAQSLGEPATQMTLNTFHAAGVSEKSNVIRGVPRLKEILRATKNMKAPSVAVVPTAAILEADDGVKDLRNRLAQTRLQDILRYSEIIYEPRDARPQPDTSHLGIYSLLADCADPSRNGAGGADPTSARWVLCFSFDPYRMLQRSVQMIDVYRAIRRALRTAFANTKIAVTFSDDSAAGHVALRIEYTMKPSDEDDEGDGGGEGEGGDEGVLDEDVLMLLQKMESDLVERVSIGGVSGISGGTIREVKTKLRCQLARITDQAVRTYAERNEKYHVVDTLGSNLPAVLAVPGVDSRRTVSNDIQEVLVVLGIEAARATIINEFQDVVTSADTYVNQHHIRLLADTMTSRGYVVSVDRHGINKNPDNSILGRASFEKTPETLLEAAVFGERDSMRGVSASVMFGQPVAVGTGMTKVLVKETDTVRVRPTTSRQAYRRGQWATVAIPAF